MDWNTLEKDAWTFAEERHAAQRYGDQPYTVHLEHVRAVLASFGHGGALGVAAWLHDTVEDTATTREEIAERFGEDVAALVWAVTGTGKNRKERNASAYEKIRQTPGVLEQVRRGLHEGRGGRRPARQRATLRPRLGACFGLSTETSEPKAFAPPPCSSRTTSRNTSRSRTCTRSHLGPVARPSSSASIETAWTSR
jgi:hypothetical protein